MKIGCPAIAFKDKKAKIDPTLCIGCKVCTQMCKTGALQVRTAGISNSEGFGRGISNG